MYILFWTICGSEYISFRLCILFHENIVLLNWLFFYLDSEIQIFKAFSQFFEDRQTDRQTKKGKHRISNWDLVHDALYTNETIDPYCLTCLYFTIIIFLRFRYFSSFKGYILTSFRCKSSIKILLMSTFFNYHIFKCKCFTHFFFFLTHKQTDNTDT